MSEEGNKSFFGQIKNQLIATIGLIITAAGGLFIANMDRDWETISLFFIN